MKIRVTIEAEIPDKVPGYGDGPDQATRAAEMTILDALGEFISHRSPAKRYVEERYPWFDKTDHPASIPHLQERKAEKIAQVDVRCSIANALKCRVYGQFGSLKVEQID
jgi:hypothetical protein